MVLVADPLAGGVMADDPVVPSDPDPAAAAAAAIQAWEALGRPRIPVAVNEHGQAYKTVVDLAAFLRTTDPTTAAERAAAIAWVWERQAP